MSLWKIGICPGDNGGALMMFSTSQQWTLVGIISYGWNCLNSTYPSVNTRVTYFLDWIRSLNVTDAVIVGGNNVVITNITSAATTTSVPIRTLTTTTTTARTAVATNTAIHNGSDVQNSRSGHYQYVSTSNFGISMLIILICTQF